MAGGSLSENVLGPPSMNEATRERLFGWQQGFDHPVVLWISVTLAGVLLLVPLLLLWLGRGERVDAKMGRELWLRYITWLVLIPLMVGPLWLGAFWTIAAVTLLSIGCYLEFARNTPIRSEWPLHLIAIAGICVINFAALDHWWELFSGAFPVTVCLLAIVALLPDRPEGFLQRVALAVFAFAFFGAGLGHLSYLANDPGFRPMLLLVLLKP